MRKKTVIAVIAFPTLSACGSLIVADAEISFVPPPVGSVHSLPASARGDYVFVRSGLPDGAPADFSFTEIAGEIVDDDPDDVPANERSFAINETYLLEITDYSADGNPVRQEIVLSAHTHQDIFFRSRNITTSESGLISATFKVRQERGGHPYVENRTAHTTRPNDLEGTSGYNLVELRGGPVNYGSVPGGFDRDLYWYFDRGAPISAFAFHADNEQGCAKIELLDTTSHRPLKTFYAPVDSVVKGSWIVDRGVTNATIEAVGLIESPGDDNPSSFVETACVGETEPATFTFKVSYESLWPEAHDGEDYEWLSRGSDKGWLAVVVKPAVYQYLFRYNPEDPEITLDDFALSEPKRFFVDDISLKGSKAPETGTR